MRCPVFAELPPPPTGKTGWPWTVETPPLSPARRDGSAWPRISIITPSYNQGQFIEETIRSVLLQGYPDLEYIIIDGGSTDHSVAIIKKYEPWLTYWVSEKDRGQPHAINKGLARASGQLLNWINSDDVLLLGALEAVACAAGSDTAIAGSVVNFGIGSSTIIPNRRLSPENIISGNPETSYQQPGFWMIPKIIKDVGSIDEDLQYVFDLHLTIKYLIKYPTIKEVPQSIAAFRLHAASKTCSAEAKFHAERLTMYRKLMLNPACGHVHHLCSYRLRSHGWWDLVTTIRNSNGPRAVRAAKIVLAMCQDPRVRFSRLSLGAVRRVLFSSA